MNWPCDVMAAVSDLKSDGSKSRAGSSPAKATCTFKTIWYNANMLYHKDISIPRRIRGMIPTGTKNVAYSTHAKEQFYDKYGKILPPKTLNFSDCEIIEVTVFGTTIDKLVLRKQYNDNHDLVIVVIPDRKDKHSWFAKTVWLNHKDDNHATLDYNRFPVN